MKVNWNTKYNTICVYTFILVCSIILFYLSISQLGVLWGKIGKVISLLQPFIFGFAIAYLLDFLLRFYESKMKNIKCFEKANFRRKKNCRVNINLYNYVFSYSFIYAICFATSNR